MWIPATRHGWIPVSVLMVACAAPLGAASVRLEAPGRPGPRAVIEWFDDAGVETRKAEVPVEGVSAEVPEARPREVSFRICSGDWISRQTATSSLAVQAVLNPGRRPERAEPFPVRLEPSKRLVLRERPAVVVLAATASSSESLMSSSVPVEVFAGQAFVKTDTGFEIRVPRGPFVICVSSGSKVEILRDSATESAVQALPLTSPDLAEITLIARAEESREPILAGVRIEAPPSPTIREHLVAAATVRRMAANGVPSQPTGAWRLGPVPVAARLMVASPGRRRSAVPIGTAATVGDLEVFLPRHQDVRLVVRMPGHQEPLAFTAELQRCSMGGKSPCQRVRDESSGPDGVVSFRSVEPGPLRLLVRSKGALLEAIDAVASDSAAAPQTLEVEAALRRFAVEGTLVLKGSATGVQGQVRWQKPAAAGVLPEAFVDTDAVGRFQIEVIGVPGALLRLEGRRAEDGLGSRPVIVALGSGDELDVTIPVEPARALRVKLTERQSGEAVQGCSVLGKTVETQDPRSSSIRSDGEGVARFDGWPAVRTSLIATCRTHRQKKPLILETADILKGDEIRLELEKSTGLRFSVKRPNGSPAPFVKLRVPDPALASLPPLDRIDQLIPVGSTDANGIYEIPPSLQGAAFWFLSPGGALAMRQATDPACEEAPCTIPVALQTPGGFSGLKLRRRSGAAVSARPLLFSIGDQLISPKLLSEAAEVSGVHVSALVPARAGEPTMIPSLLETGEYGVYAFGKDETGTPALKRLGVIAVPGTAVQEIVIDDIVKR